MRLLKRFGLDHTRGQIFVGFIVAMLIVLIVTVGSLYAVLSGVQKRNAAQFAEEIAAQTSGRLESLLSEINVLTLQFATDERVQERLLEEMDGNKAAYDERMQIRRMMYDKIVYSETIQDMELYSLSSSVYPIVDKSIEERVGLRTIAQADTSRKAGALVWLPRDPDNPDYLLAVRQVKLEKLDFAKGGYLVVRVKPSLIDFIGWEGDADKVKGSVMYLLDENGEILSAEAGAARELPDEEAKRSDYITVSKTVKETNWRLEILLPKKMVSEDVRLIQKVMLWVSLACAALFALLSYWLSQSITRPMKKLTRVMQQGKEGTLRENPELYFNREVNQLNTKYNQMVREMNHLIRSVYEIELLKSKSEITALHSQINPHFLFNTLDSIYWAHIRKGEKELSYSIIRLAELFRYAIRSPSGSSGGVAAGSGGAGSAGSAGSAGNAWGAEGDGFVSVSEEIEQVRRYADLMKLRWRERLRVEIAVDPDVAACRLPKLTIQPLVENAIVHGIEPLGRGGVVTVAALPQGKDVAIVIADNGVGMSAERLMEIRARLRKETKTELLTNGRGIGIYNVHKLVQLQFGEPFGLSIESEEGRGTTVTLTVPRREGESP